jgi:CDP-4-dehydro-6-deoxyglucose reductase
MEEAEIPGWMVNAGKAMDRPGTSGDMDKQLSVIRAAKLAGVTRGELQSRIKSGDLPSFDGFVRVDDLLQLYPETKLEDNRTLERLERIKAAALGKDVAGRTLPEPQVLAQRLAALGQRFARVQHQAGHYGGILRGLEAYLRALEQASEPQVRGVAVEIKLWVQSALRQQARESNAPGGYVGGGNWMSVMAPQVRLLPGDHTFLVEGADTVLEAALRAGLSIGYGCSNGNCGDCKARIVSGEVREVRPHDYVLSEAERDEGYALLCTVSPVTDLVIETGVARRPDQIPWQSIDAILREIQRPGPHVAVLKVQTPRTRRLRFLGGQSVRLSLAGGGLQGELPLANCPCDDRNLAFHLAENREDPFTAHCFEHLTKGDAVRIEGPLGGFVIEEEIERPLVFLAGDTGFGPIKSLIEHVIALDIADTMDLIWAACGSIGHYEDNLCRSWDDALDNFHYQEIRMGSGSDSGAWIAAVAGALAKSDARQERDYYIAGPTHFIDAVATVLNRLLVPAERRHYQPVPPRS